MKTKLFLFVVFAAWMLTGCEKNTIGDASLIEGGWDLRTVNYDKMVYADYATGNTHLKDSAYTRVFEDKEQVWLFYQGDISEWQYYVQDGEGLRKVFGQAMPATVTAITEPKAKERTSPS